MSLVRKIGWLLACLSLSDCRGGAAQQEPGEYQVKARFLANAPSFVEWPPSAFPTPAAPLFICVHGDFSFGTALAEQTRASLIKGRRMEVKWIRAEQDLLGCQVLFVSRSALKRYGKVLQTVKAGASLTIGEDSEFLKSGGMMSLEPTSRGLSFDVNLDAVHEAHLHISAQLLSLARHVLRRSEATRG